MISVEEWNVMIWNLMYGSSSDLVLYTIFTDKLWKIQILI